mmetsp:Transcript_19619/g.63051  ORF Transcript_19619/g.63051 Transcript_19619/m.63051 type:complete len:255 (-) Transcript_19619:1258-2022(-)
MSLCLPLSGIRRVRFVERHTAVFDFAGYGERKIDTRKLSQTHDRAAWMAARRALSATASEFQRLVQQPSRLLAKKKVVEPRPSSETAAMKWGQDCERFAIEQYRRERRHLEVSETGLWTDATCTFGASPDGLVREKNGETGLLEVKCLWSRRFSPSLTQWARCPTRYHFQIQGQLMICDLPFCDLVVWIPKNASNRPNSFALRVYRDDKFQDTLKAKLANFADELHQARTDDDEASPPISSSQQDTLALAMSSS